MRSATLRLGVAVLTLGLMAPLASAQDLPLPPIRGANQGVWPVFEGWYENEDGSYTIYFGYNNRNAEEVLEIPLGPDNFIEPTRFDGDQPTRLEPSRHWGVFGIRVPAGHDPEARIYWNLVIDGRTYRVPGHLDTNWKADALGGGATGNTPPVLTFGSDVGSGPMGIRNSETRRTSVGQPLQLTVAATDEAGSGPDLAALFGVGNGDGPKVTLAWFKHQGPGDVQFSPQEGEVPAEGGEMTTEATFSTPGEYVIRVRATDSPVEQSGHAQCCWTNGYVTVTVTR